MSSLATRTPPPSSRGHSGDRQGLIIDLFICAVPAVATLILLTLAF